MLIFCLNACRVDEGGFVGCEVLSGKNYVVETKNGATIIKKKKKKKSSKKNTGTKSNTKSTESVPPTKKKRRNSNSSRSSDDGWDGDAEAEVWSNSSPPSSTARSDAQDVDIEVRDTTSAMEGLPWQKLNPTFEERVGWGGFMAGHMCPDSFVKPTCILVTVCLAGLACMFACAE